MPQVASPPVKAHGHGHAHVRAARSAPAPDRGTPTLFDSLVADSTPAQQQDQGATPAPALAQKPATAQPTKAVAGQDKAGANQDPAPAQPADPKPPAAAAPATTAADGRAAADLEAAAKVVADTTQAAGAKADAPKAADKTDAKPDAAADQTAPVVVDPAILADAAAAVAPAAAPPPDKTPAAAIETVPATGQAPIQPAFIAAATAQKLQPFDGQDKPQPDKPTASDGKAALATPVPPAPDDQLAAPQLQAPAAPAAAPEAKPAVTAKPADKPEPHHAKIDAAAALPTTIDGAIPQGGADGAAAAQASATSAATGAATHASAASAGSATPQTAANALLPAVVPLAGLAVAIAGRVQAGKNNFGIRLDPPELGRIEVKLSVDRQGQVTSHLIADRADTLDLLRRDASGLERALQDAGLKTAGDGLQFSLRDQSSNGQQNGGSRAGTSQVVALDDTLPAIDPAANGYVRYAGRIGGIDIRV